MLTSPEGYNFFLLRLCEYLRFLGLSPHILTVKDSPTICYILH